MPDPPVDPAMTILARVDRPLVADADKRMLTQLDTGFATLMPYLSPAAQAEIQARFAPWLGQAQHPTLVSNEFTEFAVRRAFPDLTRAAALRRFAQLSIAQYQKSILGRVMLAPIRLMGMARMLRQLPKQWAATSNYGTRWIAECGPQHLHFECEDEILPAELLLGYIEAIADLAGVTDIQVQFSLRAPKHYAFDIRWGAAPPAAPHSV